MLDVEDLTENKPDITLNADQLEVLLRRIRDAQSGLATIAGAFKVEGTLSHGLAHSVLRVTESHIRDLGNLLGVETESAAEIERRHSELRTANMRVHELEGQLGAAQSPEMTQLSLAALKDHLIQWWELEGFGHITEIEFGPYGARAILSCHLFGDFVLLDSPTPVSDKELKAQWLQSLRDRGFELVERRGEFKVVANDTTRTVLCDLIKNRIPSARIVKVENDCTQHTGFTLRSVTVYVRKLGDIFQLPVKPKPHIQDEQL